MNDKEIDKDQLEGLYSLFIMVNDYLSQMINFDHSFINKCGDASELIDTIIKSCLKNEEVINNLMLNKGSQIIDNYKIIDNY